MKRFALCVSILCAILLLGACNSPNAGQQMAPPPPHGLPAESIQKFDCGPVLQAALISEFQASGQASDFGVQCSATVSKGSTTVAVKVFTGDGKTELANTSWTREFTDWAAVVRSGVKSLIEQLRAGPPPPLPPGTSTI